MEDPPAPRFEIHWSAFLRRYRWMLYDGLGRPLARSRWRYRTRASAKGAVVALRHVADAASLWDPP